MVHIERIKSTDSGQRAKGLSSLSFLAGAERGHRPLLHPLEG